jgi:hypothetical protein
LAALAPVGRLLGYKDHYPKYSGAGSAGEWGVGPASTTKVMLRGVAMATPLVVASLFIVRRELRLSSGQRRGYSDFRR